MSAQIDNHQLFFEPGNRYSVWLYVAPPPHAIEKSFSNSEFTTSFIIPKWFICESGFCYAQLKIFLLGIRKIFENAQKNREHLCLN
jgi:hypothetical protein